MKKCERIINIRNFSPIDNSRQFFLDTNVLYWISNPRFLQLHQLSHTARVYYDFIDKLIDAGNPLVTSVYNLTELLNVIEKSEWDIYCKLHPEIPISRKDYRNMPTEHEEVGKVMKTALNNVNNICKVIEFNFSASIIDDFVENFTTHRCDIFDYAILKNCVKSKYLNIISDDGDFSSIEKINLYTANENVLNNART